MGDLDWVATTLCTGNPAMHDTMRTAAVTYLCASKSTMLQSEETDSNEQHVRVLLCAEAQQNDTETKLHPVGTI